MQVASDHGTTREGAVSHNAYHRMMKKKIHRGAWSVAEHETFLRGIEKYGVGKWTQIATMIPTRYVSLSLSVCSSLGS